jgi:hypothetical protein
MLTYGTVPFHDNAFPHIAGGTQALLEQFRPPSLQLWPRSKRLLSLSVPAGKTGWGPHDELIEGVNMCLSSQADCFDSGIQKRNPGSTSAYISAVTTLIA